MKLRKSATTGQRNFVTMYKTIRSKFAASYLPYVWSHLTRAVLQTSPVDITGWICNKNLLCLWYTTKRKVFLVPALDKASRHKGIRGSGDTTISILNCGAMQVRSQLRASTALSAGNLPRTELQQPALFLPRIVPQFIDHQCCIPVSVPTEPHSIW